MTFLYQPRSSSASSEVGHGKKDMGLYYFQGLTVWFAFFASDGSFSHTLVQVLFSLKFCVKNPIIFICKISKARSWSPFKKKIFGPLQRKRIFTNSGSLMSMTFSGFPRFEFDQVVSSETPSISLAVVGHNNTHISENRTIILKGRLRASHTAGSST